MTPERRARTGVFPDSSLCNTMTLERREKTVEPTAGGRLPRPALPPNVLGKTRPCLCKYLPESLLPSVLHSYISIFCLGTNNLFCTSFSTAISLRRATLFSLPFCVLFLAKDLPRRGPITLLLCSHRRHRQGRGSGRSSETLPSLSGHISSFPCSPNPGSSNLTRTR